MELVAVTPGSPTSLAAKEDAAGAWTVGWSLAQPGSSGWLHRSPQGTWSAIPGLPVQFEYARNSIAEFVTGPAGPVGALVFDDGYRFDETAWVDTDPRPEHFEPFVRSAGGWQPRLNSRRAAARPSVSSPPSPPVKRFAC